MKKQLTVAPACRRSDDEWAGILDEWRRGGRIDIEEFCRTHGVSAETFKWWRWALTARGPHPRQRMPSPPTNRPSCNQKAGGEKRSAQTPGFIEIVPRAARPVILDRRGSGIEVVLSGTRGDRRVRIDVGFDDITFRRLLSMLEEV